MLYVAILLGIILCLYYVYDCLKPVNYPPGPRWLPFLGCLLSFKRLHQKKGYRYLVFNELAKIYGPVVGLKFGNQKLVLISTYKAVKENLLREEFMGRPKGFFFQMRSFGKRKGILFTDGVSWAQSRKFTMRHFRTFGLNNSVILKQLTIEANHLVKYLQRRSEEGPVLMHHVFDVSVLNTLWMMIAGHRFDYTDKRLLEALNVMHSVMKASDTTGGIVSYIPFAHFLIPELSGYNEMMKDRGKMMNLIGDEIKEHEKNLHKDAPRDLIEAFLQELEFHKDEPENSTFDRENLVMLCLDLFMAGSKTTGDTLSDMFLLLSIKPEWIQILQKELDDVIGRERLPTFEDSSSLHMLEAFIAEAHRYLILAPTGVPHRTMSDVQVNGYNIPKDTTVLFNYHSVSNDLDHWKNPEEFKPQRFLDSNGHFRNSNEYLPFGVGKRRCPGELLARPTLFLFLACILHSFDFEFSSVHEKPDLEGVDGFVMSPKPYYLKMKSRFNLKQ